jgi:methionine synthase I (cobalamin-dependent)
MNPLLAELLARGPVLTDGAWGTQLQARGLGVGDFPDLWNLTHPERVAEVAQAYVDAGSQVILTNTFGANRIRLIEAGAGDRVVEINRAGAEISRRAAGTRAKVFASIGPTGKMLMTGEVTEADLLAAFTEQATALAAGGADGLVVETMADLTEAQIAVRAAKTTGLPVVGCMVFDSGKNKDRTMMGTTPEQAAAGLAEAGADVVGANCGQGIAGFLPICARFRAATKLPIWVKGNAGLPQMVDGKVHYATTPEEFAAFIPQLIEQGASFLGGCCGTSPSFIRAVCASLGRPV